MRQVFSRFVKDEQGAALVEYGLLVGLIACVCYVAISGVGKEVNTLFTDVNAALANAVADI